MRKEKALDDDDEDEERETNEDTEEENETSLTQAGRLRVDFFLEAKISLCSW
jgi:hypothetical protein